MSRKDAIQIVWAPEYGLRPEGFHGQSEQYGLFKDRFTCFDHCPCEEEDCKGFIVRYVDDKTVCSEQTIALRLEAGMLLEMYKKAFYSMYGQMSVDMDLIEMMARLKDQVERTGIIYFYLEEGTFLERYKVVACPLFRALTDLRDAQKLQPLMLTSGKVPTNDPKTLDEPIEEKDGDTFFTDDDLNSLFNLGDA